MAALSNNTRLPAGRMSVVEENFERTLRTCSAIPADSG